jgi:hypothetical protein
LDRAFRTLRWEAEGVIDAEDPPEFVKTEEERLYEDVETFAGEMFTLPLAERRQRWAEIYRRAEHSLRVRARLDALAAGLDVDLNAVEDSARAMHVNTLARYAMELFPQRPTARAVRRHALLEALHQDDMKPWRQAAQTLKKKHPQLAALAPELIDQVAVAGLPLRVAPPQVQVRRQPSSTRGTGWGLALALCVFLSFIVRAALQSTNHNSSSSSRTRSSAEIDRLLRQLQQDRSRWQPPAVSPPSYLPPSDSSPGVAPLYRSPWEQAFPTPPEDGSGPLEGAPSSPYSNQPGWNDDLQGQAEIDRRTDAVLRDMMERARSPEMNPGGPFRTQPTPPRIPSSPPGF